MNAPLLKITGFPVTEHEYANLGCHAEKDFGVVAFYDIWALLSSNHGAGNRATITPALFTCVLYLPKSSSMGPLSYIGYLPMPVRLVQEAITTAMESGRGRLIIWQ